jgi:predicted transcriptional regulator
MSKQILEIASEIIQAQVSLSPMSADEISSSLRQVFITLMELQKAESEEIDLSHVEESAPKGCPEKLAPKDSIQENKIICLECGAEMRQLTQRHLLSHGLSPREYRRKYGFTLRTPLLAKSVTKAKSKAAKKRGLPENLVKAIEAKRQEKAKAVMPVEASSSAVAKGVKTKLRKGRKKA